MNKHPYTQGGRLSDVLALIQVLAVDLHTHRSENGLFTEFQRKPISGASWFDIAREHPEFFRVRDTEGSGLSLIVRHATPKNEANVRELSPDLIQMLLRTAIDLHDRQHHHSDWWARYAPVSVAAGAAILALAGVILQIFFRK